MMDLGGGGRRSPPNLRASAGGGVPLADGRSGRSSGGGGGPSRGSDGRFCSLSRSSDAGIEDRPVVDACSVPFGVDDGFLAGDHATSGSTMLVAACDPDAQMVEDGLLHGVSPNVTVFVKNNVFSSATGVSVFPDASNSSISVLPDLCAPVVALKASSDAQMLENGMSHDVSIPADGFATVSSSCIGTGGINFSDVDAGHVIMEEGDGMRLNASDNILESPPLPSSDFCMGSAQVNRLHQPLPAASNLCPQGVRFNASAFFEQPSSAKVFADHSQTPCDGSGNVWHRPKVVPLPSLAELGQFTKDGITAHLDEAEVAVMVKRFDNALVGRMFGRKLPYIQLMKELKLRWAAFGGFRLVTLCSDCFICFFDSVEARDAVLLGGPWVIFGQVMGIDKWSPTFSPASSVGCCTPVWIRLPGLPMYCWSSQNIGRIVALIGEPLWLDSATEQLERGLYARACVRIDLSKPLKPGVWVDGGHGKFFQAIVYEGLSVFCCRCGQVGHKDVACRSKAGGGVSLGNGQSPAAAPSTMHVQAGVKKGPGVYPPDSISSLPSTSRAPLDGKLSQAASAISGPHYTVELEAGLDVGPWMMVTRKKRFKKPPAKQLSPPLLARGNFGNATSNPRADRVWVAAVPQSKARVPTPSSRPSSKMGSPRQDLVISCSVEPHEAASSQHGDRQPSPFGFSALPKPSKARPSKPFMEKMLTDLGPIAPGLRKKRKKHIVIDGGDASPTAPP